ncbi:cell surface protein [Enterococcus mundtii]|uniref:DUF916 and DUF3324 domain-containing protein n=1 Tax=Enterococcus TaxID=1350 RepID=UPI0007EEAB88|nr:DUF916 and DUF3324 domain-containing protein [Enterococcus mundtii]OBS62548.1 cell surface protein [Enterococcus mundtii]
MKKRFILIVSLIVAMLSMVPVQSTFASEFNFAVTPVIPENQIDKEKTYFDLLMEPDKQQTIEVQLRNDTDNDITIETTINSATTNLNGVVEYGENKIEPDNSLVYNLKDYAKAEPEVTLPKHSEVTVPITVTMPAEKFDGVMAGGITFKEKTDDTQSSSSEDKGLAIKNEYSYVVALLIRQNMTAIKPDLKATKVEPAQVNARNVINVHLQNPQAVYLNQLNVATTITKKGSAEVLYESQAESMQMAPNSHFAYPISLNGEKLEAGKYTMKMTAYGEKAEDGEYKVKTSNGSEETYKYKWEFEKDFEIKGEVARELNEKDVTIEQDNTWIYLLFGILLLLILLLLFIFWKRKKQKDEDESENK